MKDVLRFADFSSLADSYTETTMTWEDSCLILKPALA